MKAIRGAAFALYGLRHSTKGGYERRTSAPDWNSDDIPSQSAEKSYKRVVVVTGGNAGLGRSTALEVAKLGHEVHILCRNQERGMKARDELAEEAKNEDVHLHIVDVSKEDDVKKFATDFTENHEKLDVLVNNAGVLLNERKETDEGYEATFATNTLGTYRLTELLLPLLEKTGTVEAPSRVVVVSSGGLLSARMDLSDLSFKNHYNGPDVYSQTKRHQLYMTELWARKHADKNIKFYCMHPGWADTPGVQTSLPSFRSRFENMLRSPDEGADTIIWLALAMRENLLSENGGFYLDRAIERTSLPLTATESTEAEKEAMMEYLVKNAFSQSEAEAKTDVAEEASASE